MNKIIAVLTLVVLATLIASAEIDDAKKTEFFAGYSCGHVGANFWLGSIGEQVYRDRVNQHGFNGSGVIKVGR